MKTIKIQPFEIKTVKLFDHPTKCWVLYVLAGGVNNRAGRGIRGAGVLGKGGGVFEGKNARNGGAGKRQVHTPFSIFFFFFFIFCDSCCPCFWLLMVIKV